MANDDLIGDTKKSAKKTTPAKTVTKTTKAAPAKSVNVKKDVAGALTKATKPVAKPAKKAEAPVGRKPTIGDDTKFKSVKGAETREGSVWAAIHVAFQGGATVADAAKNFKFKQPRGVLASQDKKAFMRCHLKDAVKKGVIAGV